ncbi:MULTISPECIES: DUF6624 domain-containing protein [unclassified Kaistella]|uniref:DUF6624 domain-containing protein n=1 Tax=unclassified Kaistella TaxID=2762626 RepID=UPI0027332DFA|nr:MULTISPECIES: DUF6624 domain-containing protein [unclassified Kaistella]MDP2454325.1 hypothetical protein [Kaistella sp. SH11-4b]MDP2457812.1 hypothetical protein [Kaistella sp. SH40-3]MDP2460718.1 hypothetical protein [Kaistella sp. SH19-2b]
MKFIYQILFVIITGLILFSCNSQTRINTDLKKELDVIMFTDQAFRRQYDPNMPEQERRNIADSLNMDYDTMRKNLLVLMNKYDAENIKKVETIISKYGYPGKSLVGEPTNRAAFLVIQHSDKISKYLPIVRIAAEKKELPFRSYALMLDRHLMEKEEQQIYGSQGLEMGGISVIWPIKDPANVNALRKKAGFSQTVEQYSKDLFGKNFEYKVYSLEEVKELFSGFTIVE